MASRNIELIRPIYEDWSRGNWRTMFDVYDEHMEWGWSSEFPGLAGVYEDPSDPNPRLRTWLSGWEFWRAEADEFLEIEDYVVVLATYHGRGRGSGVEIRQEGAHVFKLRDGKVVRLEIFASRARAIASVQAALLAPNGVAAPDPVQPVAEHLARHGSDHGADDDHERRREQPRLN